MDDFITQPVSQGGQGFPEQFIQGPDNGQQQLHGRIREVGKVKADHRQQLNQWSEQAQQEFQPTHEKSENSPAYFGPPCFINDAILPASE